MNFLNIFMDSILFLSHLYRLFFFLIKFLVSAQDGTTCTTTIFFQYNTHQVSLFYEYVKLSKTFSKFHDRYLRTQDLIFNLIVHPLVSRSRVFSRGSSSFKFQNLSAGACSLNACKLLGRQDSTQVCDRSSFTPVS